MVAIVLTVCICTRLEKEAFVRFKRNEFGTFKKERRLIILN